MNRLAKLSFLLLGTVLLLILSGCGKASAADQEAGAPPAAKVVPGTLTPASK